MALRKSPQISVLVGFLLSENILWKSEKGKCHKKAGREMLSGNNSGLRCILRMGCYGIGEFGRGSRKVLLPPVTVHVAICALVWGKVDNRIDRRAPFLPCLGRYGEKNPKPCPQGVRVVSNEGGKRGEWQELKCVQVKGRVAFASPLARKSAITPNKAGRIARLGGKERCHQGGKYARLVA